MSEEVNASLIQSKPARHQAMRALDLDSECRAILAARKTHLRTPGSLDVCLDLNLPTGKYCTCLVTRTQKSDPLWLVKRCSILVSILRCDSAVLVSSLWASRGRERSVDRVAVHAQVQIDADESRG